MARGRRAFVDKMFDLALLLTLTLLYPLQILMGSLVKSTREDEISVTDVVRAVERCVDSLCELIEDNVAIRTGKWFALHAGRATWQEVAHIVTT